MTEIESLQLKQAQHFAKVAELLERNARQRNRPSLMLPVQVEQTMIGDRVWYTCEWQGVHEIGESPDIAMQNFDDTFIGVAINDEVESET